MYETSETKLKFFVFGLKTKFKIDVQFGNEKSIFVYFILIFLAYILLTILVKISKTLLDCYLFYQLL